MNRYYMKMKELRNRLMLEDFSITERMIKHYIDIGILNKPYYKHSNQALYGDEHYVRLKRILSQKRNGKTIGQIKEEILKENEDLIEEAKQKNINSDTIEDISYELSSYRKEEAMLIKETINSEKTYDKVEILDLLDCESSVLDLSVDAGVIEDKEEYTAFDVYVLSCVRNLIQVKKQSHKISGQLIERISEISKIGAASKQIADLISTDEKNTWVFSMLTEAIILKDIKDNMDKTSFTGKITFAGTTLDFKEKNNLEEAL